MPVEDLQEKLDIAYKKLQQAIDELCLACEKYKDLSDEIKEQIEFDKSDIFDIGYEAQYKNDYKPDLYILKKEHTIATIPNYLELYDKYVVAKKEYEELKILIEEAKKQEESIDYLDDSPAGKITSQLPIETSVLNTYRNWGINRICLDGFQNHLPQDAKGTRCYLHFMVDGKWVDRDTALANKNKITKIRFADNGVGYSLKNLKYFASVKDPEEGAAGQFGEGLKLVAMACVNRDLDFEVRSKNWVAKAFGTEETIDSYRTGERVDKEYLQLTWDIKTYSEGEIKGSRTIINKPSRELIDYALGLPERILPLSGKRPIAKTYAGNIVDTEEGERIFVKGILLRYLNHSFFSYDFDTKDINPDRNDFSYSYFLDSMIPATLQWCIGNPDVIKPLVYHLLDYYSDPKVQENIEDMKNAPIECSAA